MKTKAQEYAELATLANSTGKRIVKDENGNYSLTDPEPAPLTQKDYESAVQAHIDGVAQQNDFDNIQTCTKYAGFDNAFRAHAEALLAWNVSCWVACHTVMDAVAVGTRSVPTIAELLAELPEFAYPAAEPEA